MKGFNKTIIVGNVTKDIEVRTTAGGQSVASFTLAVSRVYKDGSGNKQEQTSFIPCVAWSKTGETIAQYVKKGQPLLVSGRLDQRTYEDKDGNKRSVFEVSVEDFNFLGGKADKPEFPQIEQAYAQGKDVVLEDIDDKPIDLSQIPF